MRKMSIRQPPIHSLALLRETAEGCVIEDERRGEPVLKPGPVSALSCMPADAKAQIFLSTQEVWERMPVVNDSSKLIEEDRDR